jgi:hypothetical protein
LCPVHAEIHKDEKITNPLSSPPSHKKNKYKNGDEAMTGTALALSPLPASSFRNRSVVHWNLISRFSQIKFRPFSQCAIRTPSSVQVSPESPVFLSLLLFLLPKSKDEVLPSGVSW